MANKKDLEKQIEALKKLGLSDAEIAKVLEDDNKIDHGEKLFELPDELKQGAKKARQADRTTAKTATKRERKQDDNKRFLIDLLVKSISPEADKEIEITNPEREFMFEYSGKKYKVVLSCPRT